MAQFVAIDKKVEVIGDAVLSVVEGVGVFHQRAITILERHGITNPTRGVWYSQQGWLDAFRTISETVGAATLKQIGVRIPETAVWPPNVTTVDQALASIDVAFHLNHRLNKQVLFDMMTGKMSEGIGHYGFKSTGPRSATMVCDNSYPCDFDFGIIESAARKFATAGMFVRVMHDDKAPCRKKGGNSCTYHVAW